MKFDVSSSVLLSRLQSIGKVIATKNLLPILDSFLFNMEGNTLRVTASDTETRLVTSVDVTNVEGEGVFAVSAKLLIELLKELSERQITIDINDDNLSVVIRCHNGKYNFIGEEGDIYPQPNSLDDDAVSISIDAQMLSNGLCKTLFAMGNDELHPVMNGVYFDIHTDDLTLVASDGLKLVRLRNMAVKSPIQASLILPKKPANLLRNLLAKESGQALIRFDNSNMYVTCTNFEMVCRLMEGRYPNYNSVIPKDNPFKLTVDRISFLNAIRRVSVFSNPSNSLVKLHLKDNLIDVSAQDADFSTSAEESISCQFDGEEMVIGFKGTNLIEVLGAVSSEKIVLELSDSSHAGLIVPSENDENEDLLMLLMPMLLGD